MNPPNNYGLIIRELRRRQCLSVRKTAVIIGRSIGWLSEIENGVGTARLTEFEFERIVAALDGGRFKALFKTWIANLKNADRTDKSFDGAVLKYIRVRKGLRLREAATLLGFSVGYVSKLEIGYKPMTLKLRQKIMEAYGYNPNSFKNLSTDPVRSVVVPSKYKLEILLRTFTAAQMLTVLNAAKSQSLGGNENV